jgi:hypothetical protein
MRHVQTRAISSVTVVEEPRGGRTGRVGRGVDGSGLRLRRDRNDSWRRGGLRLHRFAVPSPDGGEGAAETASLECLAARVLRPPDGSRTGLWPAARRRARRARP